MGGQPPPIFFGLEAKSSEVRTGAIAPLLAGNFLLGFLRSFLERFLNKKVIFRSFLKFQSFINFKPFWEGFGKVLGRFGKDLGRFGEGFGGAATGQNEGGPADRAQRLNPPSSG